MDTISQEVRCVGYIRVSTERQAGEQFTSLADQRAAIEQTAARLGLQVGAWYADEGASGATVDGRPRFRAMLHACERSPRSPRAPGVILVLNDSRFGRFPDPDEAAALRFRCKQSGWLVRFCEGDDVEDVTFRSVIRSLGSAQASEYRRNIQRNAKRGAKGSATQGFWTREAPFGYRRKVVYPPGAERVLERGVLKAPNERVSLTPDEHEAAIVRWAFKAYDAGTHSLGMLARDLLERTPGRRWSTTVVHHLLKNPAYVGDIVGGRRPADRTERMITHVRPKSEWYGKQDAHPAIVGRDLFERVQKKLAKNRHRRIGSPVFYLMTGLLICTHCGRHYYAGGIGGRKERGPNFNRFYMCSGSGKRPVVCPGRIGNVSRHIIDDVVISTIAAALKAPAVQRKIEAEVDRALSNIAPGAAAALAHLDAAEARLQQSRERVVSAIADGTLLRSEATAQLDRIRAELATITSQRAQLQLHERRAETARAERDRLLAMALDFPRVAQHLQGPALRQLVELWLDHATFDKVTRVLTLGIRPIPALPALVPSGLPGQTEQNKALKPIIRRVNLQQTSPGKRVAGGGR